MGLEHVEPQTGRRIGSIPIDLATMTGRKARFLPGDIVYGYLRPYLNKVWIAAFEGFCWVDQYVFIVDADHRRRRVRRGIPPEPDLPRGRSD